MLLHHRIADHEEQLDHLRRLLSESGARGERLLHDNIDAGREIARLRAANEEMIEDLRLARSAARNLGQLLALRELDDGSR